MITSEEVFDHRRLFYLPNPPHNPKTTASRPKTNKQTNKHKNKNPRAQNPTVVNLNQHTVSVDVEISLLIIYSRGSSMKENV